MEEAEVHVDVLPEHSLEARGRSLFHVDHQPLRRVAVHVHLDLLPHRLIHQLALPREETERRRQYLAWPVFSAVPAPDAIWAKMM